MPKVNGQARVEYRDKGGSNTRQVLIFAIAPGDSMSDWRTENIRGIGDLTRLMDDAGKVNKITLITRADAATIFTSNRDIDLLSIQFNEAASGGKLLITASKGLKVVKSLPVTSQLLPAVQKTVGHAIAGVEAGKAQLVTLQLSEKFVPS